MNHPTTTHPQTTPPRISRKYHLPDHPNLQEQRRSPSISRAAAGGRLPDRISVKLQAIRTMLGYQDKQNSRQRIATVLSRDLSASPPQENAQKAMNLKQFVSYMRRRNEMVDEYLGETKRSKMCNKVGVQDSNSTIREYSDLTLKFMHSFLPHGAMEERKKRRLTVSGSTGATTLSPQRSRVAVSAAEGSHTTTLTPQKSDHKFEYGGKSRTDHRHFRHLSLGQPSIELNPSQVRLEQVRHRELPYELIPPKVEESYQGKNYRKDLLESTRTQRSLQKQHRQSLKQQQTSCKRESNSRLPSVKPLIVLGCQRRG